jgi:hypothetical protein
LERQRRAFFVGGRIGRLLCRRDGLLVWRRGGLLIRFRGHGPR